MPKPGSIPRYMPSGAGATTALLALFAIRIIIDIAAIATGLVQRGILLDVRAGIEGIEADVAAVDSMSTFLEDAQIALFILIGCTFLYWFYHAHKNLHALGATNLTYTSGWAVGGFFVPILNAYRPYQIANEIWRNSISVRSESGKSTYADGPYHSYTIDIWWFTLLLGGIFNRGVASVSGHASSIESWIEVYNRRNAHDQTDRCCAETLLRAAQNRRRCSPETIRREILILRLIRRYDESHLYSKTLASDIYSNRIPTCKPITVSRTWEITSDIGSRSKRPG